MRIDRVGEFFSSVHNNKPHADVANGVIVDASRTARDYHFRLVQTAQIGNPNQLFWITAGDARRRHVFEAGCTSGGDHSPLSPGEFRQPLAYGESELIQLDVMLCS